MNAQSAPADAEQEAADSDAWALADAASAAAGVTIHQVRDAPECRIVLDVLNTVWGASEPEVLDLGFMVALAHAGNLVVRADLPQANGGRPVGGAVGFSGPPGAPFHSHIVGVSPDLHGRGVGRAIKLYQRAWCLDRGMRTMAWTYDPLVARNAYFNLHRLGVRAVGYHQDFYGVMRDSINAGQRSDRMVVHWDLTEVSGVASGLVGSTGPAVVVDPPGPSGQPDLTGAAVAVTAGSADPEYRRDLVDALAPGRAVLVGLPADIERLRIQDPEVAQRWRSATRAAFTDLLSRGWTAVDFTSDGYYVLTNETNETNGAGGAPKENPV